MNICGEHGGDIAFSGRDCPACSQIEDIEDNFKEEMASLEDSFESDMNDMQDTIDALEAKVTEPEAK